MIIRVPSIQSAEGYLLGPSPHDHTILAETSPDHEDRNLISATLTNSTHLMAYNEAPDSPSRGASVSPPTQSKRKCTSCLETIDDLAFAGRCGHDYCFDCMKSLFIGATRDESIYPPRCCGQPIPREISRQVPNREELSKFDQRVVEYTTPNRLYCANPTCSHIIPKVHIKNEHGTCPSCHKKTHLPCLSLEHPGTDCPEDEGLKQILALSMAKNWQRCGRCQTMVELGIGGAHIICR